MNNLPGSDLIFLYRHPAWFKKHCIIRVEKESIDLFLIPNIPCTGKVEQRMYKTEVVTRAHNGDASNSCCNDVGEEFLVQLPLFHSNPPGRIT